MMEIKMRAKSGKNVSGRKLTLFGYSAELFTIRKS